MGYGPLQVQRTATGISIGTTGFTCDVSIILIVLNVALIEELYGWNFVGQMKFAVERKQEKHIEFKFILNDQEYQESLSESSSSESSR